MSFLSESEARQITEKVLSYAKAPATVVTLNPVRAGNTRFSRNEAQTSGATETMNVGVQSIYGLKKGASTTDQYDDRSLLECVQRAEELARFAPDDKETMPVLGPQKYLMGNAYSPDVEAITPEWRAKIAADAIEKSRAKGLVAAGFVEHQATANVVANSKGLFAYEKESGVAYSLTARSTDETGSGWGGGTANRLADFDAGSMTARALDLAVRSQKPVALEPGNYTTILSPECVADLTLTMFFGGFNARNYDEGRSFLSQLSKQVEGGEKIFGEKVTIYTDPQHPENPSNVFDGEGFPIKKTEWITEGVVKTMACNRYWAENGKKKREPQPFPANGIMVGGKTSIDEMVASTKRGLIVARLWYIRPLDPQTCLFTGLTRDGLFLIENGKITKPVKNFRWNETPVKMLRNIEAMGPSRRVITSEQDLGSNLFFPALKVTDFTFASLSDAV
ncbi:MAG: TldD/PmbA family protein [Acidobacteria bacterium]|nr:TldD/PmbA family protein [Acidobacteriota bacterium]